MKAAYIEQNGGPDVFKYGDLPDPKAGPGEIVVDIVAATVNGADWKVRNGDYGTALKFPYVLGRDFSGTVAAVGEGVADFKPGDEVFAVLPAGQEGTYAEKIAIKAEYVAKKPAGVSHVDAAALALTGLTAIDAVDNTLKLKAGETILIQGGAGGVAGFAIRFAKHLGARVISTASTANVDYVRALGADQVIDYTKEDFTKIGRVCDAVFETVGGEVATKSYEVLKPGGRAAFIASGPKAPPTARTDVQGLRPGVPRTRAAMERIGQLAASGAVKAPEVRLFKLSDAAETHRISQGRHFRGKLVFKVR
ncbi:MAG: NADP-dependent oxidoreductase [Alphaproteobacteria bacterium]|nr:NADP-dependent oxidoreductase [Alphaproteobacteria bacterium]